MADGTGRVTLGILAHVDAGKTTLCEALLYRTGEIRRPGRVDHGDAYLDDNEIERNRGITIFSRQAGFRVSREDHETLFTIIDTPGHTDLASEMERSLWVIDHALLVVSGSEGVRAHTRTLYRMLCERGIPVFIFINKMDIAVRAREDILAELAEDLGAPAADFTGAADRTSEFIDAVTLHSSALAELVLSGSELSDSDIAGAVSRREVVPCMFGSALKMTGIESLLETLARFASEPERTETFGARVYKTQNSEDSERLCFIKVTGGDLRVRDRIHGRSAGGAEWEDKISQIRFYSGSKYTAADHAPAGSVCAVTGLSRALPGDGIGAEMPAEPARLRPHMVYTVSGPDGMDPHQLMKDLMLLAEEDPSLSPAWADGSDGIRIRIMGQVHLEVLGTVICDRFGYDVTFSEGGVLYLETVSGTYEGIGHFEPLRHYAEVHVIIGPGEPGSGIVIDSAVPEDELARNWQRLILSHLEEKEHKGVLTGAPITDVRMTLAAGRAHDKHTSGGDFREATYRAVRNALMQARRDGRAVLLEPWEEYDIELPSRCVGRAMTDIRQMGGVQDSLEQDQDRSRVRGKAPASELAGYQMTLTGYTSGEGRMSVVQSGYEPCHDADRVIAESGYDPERDTNEPADSVFVTHGASDIVKWDKVPDRMHLPAVLRKTGSAVDGYRSSFSAARTDGPSAGSKEERDRRAAAEKELKHIFERTYGPEKDRTQRGPRAKDFTGLSEEEAARNEARNLEIRAKHERRPAAQSSAPDLVLIDGYNLIHADPYLRELAEKDMGAARDQLIDRLCNYAGYTGRETILVFDAYRVPLGAGSDEDILGLRVMFTAEDEPADIRMGKIAAEAAGRSVYVVTSDSLVQQDALVHGALRISSGEFLSMLDSSEEEIRRLLGK